jgi:cytoskeletal protein CcmA (bactofilin family)
MNKLLRIFLPVMLAVVLLLSLPQQAQAAHATRVIVGGTFTLESGETLNEDLSVVGGAVVLEEGSTVNGTVFVLGGSLEVNGAVNGDIVATGGYIQLGESAVVDGDITSAGGYVDQDTGAQISGEMQSELSGPFPLVLPGVTRLPVLDISFSPVWNGLWFLAQVLMLSALAVLLAMFLPKHLERVDRTLATQPLIAGGMGLLTGAIAPLVVVFMVITICLIPAALLGLVALGILLLIGWVAFGLEVGKRLAVLLKQQWAMPISAGVGTFALTLVIGGVGKLWCIGWLFPTAVCLVGLGAAILTRAGTQDYPEVISPPVPGATEEAPEEGL